MNGGKCPIIALVYTGIGRHVLYWGLFFPSGLVGAFPSGRVGALFIAGVPERDSGVPGCLGPA